MDTINRISDFINSEIAAISYPAEPSGLYKPIQYTLAGGGKRLRPTLLLLSCEAFGKDFKLALPQALGIEIYHNFTLLHDDVMDHADLRRGRPTVHRRWNEATAILSGDAMLTLATQYIVKNAGEKTARVLDVFNRMAIDVYEGQQFDMDFEKHNDVTLNEYLNMIRLKTSVLLGCACEIGAIMADAPQADVERLRHMAIDMGIAFQLQDDYLDTFGDPSTFGKQIGGDIVNAKKTALLIIAAKRDPSIYTLINSDIDDDEKITAVTRMFISTEAVDECRKMIDDYARKAIDTLDSVNIGEDAKAHFRKLIEKCSVRNV